MKKYLAIMFLCLISTTLSFGQKKGKPYKISLDKLHLVGIITDFKVFDLREKTNELGITYTGVNKTKRIAKLENGAVYQFENLLKISTPFKKEHEDSLILVIKEMSTLEDFVVKKVSLNTFFELYVKRDSLYFKADHFDGFSFYKNYRKHAQHITKDLQTAVSQFQQTFFRKEFEYKNGISHEKLMNQKVKYTYDILKTKQYNPGFYRTYAEFVNNTPSVTDIQIFTQEEQLQFKNIIAYDILQIKNTENISSEKYREKFDQMWGFSDGKNIFINNKSLHDADFFSKIESKGPYCYFLSLKSEGSASFLDFALGLTGGLIGSAISKGVRLSIGATYSKKINNSNGQGYVLKLENQKIVIVNVSTTAYMLRSDPKTLNAYKDEKKRHKRAIKIKYLQLFNERNTESFLKRME